jgi:adenylosuccinate synthase
MTFLLLVSGPVAVGKSAVATVLIQEHGFQGIKSSQYLRDLAQQRNVGQGRTDLQALGDQLDEQTDYRWLIDDVAARAMAEAPQQERWLLDAVRKARQVEHFRKRFGDAILHAHFSAPETVLEQRYSGRLAAGGEHPGNTSYADAIRHPNEIASRNLVEIADIVIDLEHTSSQDAASAILKKWRERARS